LPEEGTFEDAFPPRWLYGTYVQDTLKQVVAEHEDFVSLEHVRSRAVGVTRQNDRYKVRTEREEIVADAVVLATGLPPPVQALRLKGHPIKTVTKSSVGYGSRMLGKRLLMISGF
jgi:uncharacterized NAD(P)/FAD-binding protein YdhS